MLSTAPLRLWYATIETRYSAGSAILTVLQKEAKEGKRETV
jgi:hypothetical protein